MSLQPFHRLLHLCVHQDVPLAVEKRTGFGDVELFTADKLGDVRAVGFGDLGALVLGDLGALRDVGCALGRLERAQNGQV